MNDHKTGREKLKPQYTTLYGKPFIPGGPEFNTHSGEMVVLEVNHNENELTE
ncbi:hypothetical protein HGB07_06450 [Candidatus Roizmanbacteria bacterium]|nr:hypothetical protein [Candidatus Roizmanbacteria bacterium]